MEIKKFSLRLLATHALMTIILVLLFFLLFGLLKSEIYQWAVTVFLILIFWISIYADASSFGQNDAKREAFYAMKGFYAGLAASIPGLALYFASLAYAPVEFVLRLWLIPYAKIFSTFDSIMPHLSIVFILLFPLVSGLSYMDGIRRRNKVLKAIEAKNAMRAELSKRN